MAGSRELTTTNKVRGKKGTIMKNTIAIVVSLLVTAGAYAAPDLVIQNQKINPSATPLGEKYTVTFTMRNSGDAIAYVPAVSVSIPSGATYLRATSVYPCSAQAAVVTCTGANGSLLGAGSFNNFSFDFNAPNTVGPMTIAIEADPAKSVTETSETNNKATLASQSFERPKLAASATVCPTSPRTVGQGYAFALRIKNVGNTTVRYGALQIDITGGPAMITSTVPTVAGLTLNSSANSRSFLWAPGTLNPGDQRDVTVFMKSSAPHALVGKATVVQDNENTPADNVATCQFAVQ